MLLALIILVIVLVFLTILFKLKNISSKIYLICLLSVALIATVSVCCMQPKMHNRISMDVIDYLIKFNTDGSMTTTKQVSTEVLQEVKK